MHQYYPLCDNSQLAHGRVGRLIEPGGVGVTRIKVLGGSKDVNPREETGEQGYSAENNY